MSADQYLARLSCRDELNDSPLSATAVPYVEALLVQRYAKRTIGLYLHALQQFPLPVPTGEAIALAVTVATKKCPQLQQRKVSPHTLRHYLPFLTMSCPVVSS
ncbi:hypothetical protein ACM7YY_32600 [Pseudomonas aeruginosa]|uniref:hypothetical protein n=1 Tax=Pseudomonas sp. TaxID=306 RepID=UPI0029B5C305|nr:hypothetical protein [Pseudomonas sp.]MDX3744419.1 hypothetical protein [Pseudomonas sp.]